MNQLIHNVFVALGFLLPSVFDSFVLKQVEKWNQFKTFCGDQNVFYTTQIHAKHTTKLIQTLQVFNIKNFYHYRLF